MISSFQLPATSFKSMLSERLLKVPGFQPGKSTTSWREAKHLSQDRTHFLKEMTEYASQQPCIVHEVPKMYEFASWASADLLNSYFYYFGCLVTFHRCLLPLVIGLCRDAQLLWCHLCCCYYWLKFWPVLYLFSAICLTNGQNLQILEGVDSRRVHLPVCHSFNAGLA